MGRYAEGTSVEVEKSKADIERLVKQHGASGFMVAWEDMTDNGRSILMFRLRGRMLRYAVEKPSTDKFSKTRKGSTIAKERSVTLRLKRSIAGVGGPSILSSGPSSRSWNPATIRIPPSITSSWPIFCFRIIAPSARSCFRK